MKIAAFNVQNLGMEKVSDTFVRNYLIKIVSRYTVVVLLEVRDASGAAMERFLTELNRKNRQNPFAMESSEPLGRGAHREKFVFLYRENEVSEVLSHQYQERHEDVLAREPFVVQFTYEAGNGRTRKLVLIPVHSKPRDARIELNALDAVVKEMRDIFQTNNIMILGDFNASGPYLSARGRRTASIANPPYHWLIDDDVDTTTSTLNNHTYDRIVVFGQRMLDAVVPESATAFDFQEEYDLTEDQAREISDHYPVEVELYSY